MGSYSVLSKIYDEWQNNNPPSKWADFAERIIKRHCKLKKGDGEHGALLILDLGCGTGDIAIEMSKRSYEVIAIDKSDEMLSVAKEKQGADDVQFVCQDITKFELYGTVDIMICFLDTVNHITNETKLDKVFSLCKNYLNPGGILIFDIASDYYFSEILGNKTFFDIADAYTIIWNNMYNAKSCRNKAEITVFEENEYGDYARLEETIIEKHYSTNTIVELLSKNNLDITAQYSDFRFVKPSQKTERIFFVAENKIDLMKENLKLESNKMR